MSHILAGFSSVPTGIEAIAEQLTSYVPITSVPTTMTVPYETITSVLYKAASKKESALSVLATATNTITQIGLENDIVKAQATLNYYSVLQDLATQTNEATKSTMLEQAAEASAIMNKLFKDNAFYSGNYPSLGGNAALVAVFAIMLVFQVIFGVFYHQWWFLTCWTCGLFLEILGYVGRIWSHENIDNMNAFVMQLVCLTLAPCFLMAGIYYIIAQLTLVYGRNFSFLRPMQYSLIFIIADLISIILQAAGGGIASGALQVFESARPGANVMVGGLAFQAFTIGVFQFFWYTFLWKIYKSYQANGDAEFNPKFKHIRERRLHFIFMGAVSVAVVLIFVRSVYRVVELAKGWSSNLAVDEIYFMILEALMISLASLIMTVFHPGLAYGRNSHLYIDKSLRATFSKHHKSEISASADLMEKGGDQYANDSYETNEFD
ncbi:phospholipid-translocating ATPase [Martiniozyma asiatica (nom. inval.)]|nr:phospholipid-translocating ATPase [Martiniozyma asiatica]